jgi:Beta-lactamase class A
MIELFRRAESGDLRLDDRLGVANQFHSLADGSPYTLSAADDSDTALYQAIGQALPLRELCEAMITKSSNLATNLLIERLGPRRIQATAGDLGAPGVQVVRGVEDQKAFDQGLNNTTDAIGLLTLFWRLGRGEAVSRSASAAMIDILERQTLNEAIPAGLPPGTVVAHKTGSITAVQHDGGVVYGRRPYALVVLTRGIQDEKVSARLIADITRVIDGIAR